jgi:hypothetical protein
MYHQYHQVFEVKKTFLELKAPSKVVFRRCNSCPCLQEPAETDEEIAEARFVQGEDKKYLRIIGQIVALSSKEKKLALGSLDGALEKYFGFQFLEERKRFFRTSQNLDPEPTLKAVIQHHRILKQHLKITGPAHSASIEVKSETRSQCEKLLKDVIEQLADKYVKNDRSDVSFMAISNGDSDMAIIQKSFVKAMASAFQNDWNKLVVYEAARQWQLFHQQVALRQQCQLFHCQAFLWQQMQQELLEAPDYNQPQPAPAVPRRLRRRGRREPLQPGAPRMPGLQPEPLQPGLRQSGRQ